LLVVQIDELMITDLPEHGQRDQRKNERYEDFPMPGGHSVRHDRLVFSIFRPHSGRPLSPLPRAGYFL